MKEKRKSDLKRPNSGRPFQPDPKKFVCSVCNKKFKHSGSLQNHFDAVHSKKFVCNVCQRKFTQSGVLQSHFNIFHSALKSSSSDLKKDVDVDTLRPQSPLRLDLPSLLQRQRQKKKMASLLPLKIHNRRAYKLSQAHFLIRR